MRKRWKYSREECVLNTAVCKPSAYRKTTWSGSDFRKTPHCCLIWFQCTTSCVPPLFVAGQGNEHETGIIIHSLARPWCWIRKTRQVGAFLVGNFDGNLSVFAIFFYTTCRQTNTCGCLVLCIGLLAGNERHSVSGMISQSFICALEPLITRWLIFPITNHFCPEPIDLQSIRTGRRQLNLFANVIDTS